MPTWMFLITCLGAIAGIVNIIVDLYKGRSPWANVALTVLLWFIVFWSLS